MIQHERAALHINNCRLCSAPSKRLLPLNGREQKIATRLIFLKYRRQISDWTIIGACESCFQHLYHIRYQIIHMVAQIKHSTMSDPRKHKHDIKCQCEQCKSRNGDLPLLVQVIEQKTYRSDPGPSSSRPDTSARKEMVCEHCKKVFTHRGDMNKHLRIHTKEQPFVCDVCQRKFAHTSNLQRHMRIHTGDKPFKCRMCDKSFSRKDKLDAHRNTKSCGSTSN